jgi:cell division protein FtsB
MLVDAIVGEQGAVALGRARREFDRMTEQVRRLKAENELMREQNRRLREDRSALEETARRELGLMKPGEKVFIIKDLPSPTQP